MVAEVEADVEAGDVEVAAGDVKAVEAGDVEAAAGDLKAAVGDAAVGDVDAVPE
ncbi:hypothetical protein [Nonomuraea insulae]|uniref:Uncharacterized protein n=1 Tax=Nonomuraea insulae TaxID=1616787 RepID=A0ABW1D2T4_9ACTN